MTLPCLSSDIIIHEYFFKHGIIVIKSLSETDLNHYNNKELISYNDNFSILPIENFDKRKIKFVNKQRGFLEKLIPNTLSNIDISTKIVLFNSSRRAEIFLPIRFEKEKIGIYLHAWIAQTLKNSELLSFRNVKQYITAGCLFGSRMKAKSKNSEDLFTLIQIDMDFFLDKQINNIIFSNDSESIYETFLFYELERFAKLIQALSPTEARRTLFYHLPYYDYILFTTVLLVRNRITYEAFHDFHQIILNVSEVYIKKIIAIFQPYAIDVIIESPYQNIFGVLPQRNQYTTDDLLNKLGISLIKLANDLPIEVQKEKEKELIQNCWNNLINNKLDLLHKEIWGHFSILYNAPPNSFKELLERANAMMLARASWKQEHFTTCSLLPHSEKQIQIGYSKLLKCSKLTKEQVLSEVINLTIFDPVVTCSQEKNIGVFTCDNKVKDLEKAIQLSRKNLFFSSQENPSMAACSKLNTALNKNI
ncbi:MAG: hypothetical protein RLY40_909 [Pseudomonadota bacterium]|jgi:hypothetical protein